MLSRSEFQTASIDFARRYPQWQRVDGHRPGYGYLTRTTSHFGNPQKFHVDDECIPGTDDFEAEDIAATNPSESATLTVQEYIVYSASFNVPAFYFTAHASNGAPCSLVELLASSFFKVKPPAGTEATDYALTLPSVPFPLLSQGELPGVGTPCWYFHPCETAAAVNEFLVEVADADWSEEARLVRWFELWLMIVGSVLHV